MNDIFDIRALVIACLEAFQILVIEGQEIVAMEFDGRKILLRGESSWRPGDSEFLGTACKLISEDIAGEVEVWLRPHSDGKKRDLDFFQVFGGRSLPPEVIVYGMPLHL